MKHTQFFLAFIVLIYALSAQGDVAGTPPPDPGRGVVKLVSPSGSCATGFFVASNTILTNAHVARALCPADHCAGVEISWASNAGERASNQMHPSAISIVASSRALDLALLAVDGVSPPGALPLIPAKIVNGAALQVLGFPSCGPLTKNIGTLSSISSIALETTLPVSFGSSGSPILTPEGGFVGVVMQSASVLGAIRSHLLGGDFGARAVPASVVVEWIGGNPEDRITLSAKALFEYYIHDVQPVEGFSRLWRGYEFLTLVEFLRWDAARSGENSPSTTTLLGAGSFPDELMALPPPPPRGTSAFLLALAASIESKGLHNGALRPLSPSMFERPLSNTDVETQRAATDLVDRAARLNYPGYELMLLSGVIVVGGACVLLSAIWGFSIGIVWSALSGGFLSRLFRVILFAVAWPLSIGIAVILLRRRRGPRVAP